MYKYLYILPDIFHGLVLYVIKTQILLKFNRVSPIYKLLTSHQE